jgi:hypothetical protein
VAISAAAALVALAGCGGNDGPSDGQQIKTTLITYYTAFGNGDSATACNQLAATTVKALEQAAGGKPCEKVLDQALKRPDYAKVAPKLSRVEVSRVNIVGDKASADAAVPGVGRKATVPLKKEKGSWKIASRIGQ